MITVQFYKQHDDPRNMPWFEQVWQVTEVGGLLQTDVGAYVKTATGWVRANNTPNTPPLLLRGKIDVAKQRVSFDMSGLGGERKAYVKGVAKTLNEEAIPALHKQGKRLTGDNALVYAMYKNAQDFSGGIIYEPKGTPENEHKASEHRTEAEKAAARAAALDAAWAELQSLID